MGSSEETWYRAGFKVGVLHLPSYRARTSRAAEATEITGEVNLTCRRHHCKPEAYIHRHLHSKHAQPIIAACERRLAQTHIAANI